MCKSILRRPIVVLLAALFVAACQSPTVSRRSVQDSRAAISLDSAATVSADGESTTVTSGQGATEGMETAADSGAINRGGAIGSGN